MKTYQTEGWNIARLTLQPSTYYDSSMVERKIMNAKCPKCGYEWITRTERPKACPECKARLGYMKAAKHAPKSSPKPLASDPASTFKEKL